MPNTNPTTNLYNVTLYYTRLTNANRRIQCRSDYAVVADSADEALGIAWFQMREDLSVEARTDAPSTATMVPAGAIRLD